MREIVHIQVGQCGNQIGAKVKQIFHAILSVYQLYLVEEAKKSQRLINVNDSWSYRLIERVDTPFYLFLSLVMYELTLNSHSTC